MRYSPAARAAGMVLVYASVFWTWPVPHTPVLQDKLTCGFLAFLEADSRKVTGHKA